MSRSRDAVPEGSVSGRRQILKGAGVGAAGMAALALSSPALARSRAAASQGTMPAQEPVVWRCQTAWSLEDDFQAYIKTLAEVLGMLTEGRLQLEILPAGKVVPTDALAEAVSGGRLDACHRTLTLDSLRQPAIGLWGSGPAFGMDALTLLS